MLNDEERRRIIEDEARRAEEARLREDYRRTSGHAREGVPGYWLGFILNLILIGAGFWTIRETAWGWIWLIGALILNLSTGGVTWVFTALGVLVHYHLTYQSKYGPTRAGRA